MRSPTGGNSNSQEYDIVSGDRNTPIDSSGENHVMNINNNYNINNIYLNND